LPLAASLIFSSFPLHQALVRACNSYLNAGPGASPPRLLLVQSVARFVARILGIMGCSWEAEAGGGGEGREATLSPLLNVVTAFRDTLRGLARAGAPPAQLLAACDALRDVHLPELGVRVDDVPPAMPGAPLSSVWKLCSAEELRLEAEREAETRRVKEAAAAAAREEAARRAAEKQARARVPPADMFRGALAEYAGQFSAWDDAGFPNADKDGQPLSKGLVKKLAKALEIQVKLYETAK